jgi:hypothetical protein
MSCMCAGTGSVMTIAEFCVETQIDNINLFEVMPCCHAATACQGAFARDLSLVLCMYLCSFLLMWHMVTSARTRAAIPPCSCIRYTSFWLVCACVCMHVCLLVCLFVWCMQTTMVKLYSRKLGAHDAIHPSTSNPFLHIILLLHVLTFHERCASQ